MLLTTSRFYLQVLAALLTISYVRYVWTLQYNNSEIYLVALKDSDIEDAIALAKENHYRVVKQVKGFKDIYVFEKLPNLSNNAKRSHQTNPKQLHGDQRVLWANLQQPIKRSKRDIVFYPLDEYFDDSKIYHDIENIPRFNDELWGKQWYMQNNLNLSSIKKLDLNVLPVYAKGITGKGVRVSVLDDGLEFDHEDLIDNFDPDISWDCNNDSPDPRPDYTDFTNRHGTRCAGEIAMVANNKKCGVGIAYNARIGGIKLLDSILYDFIEGMALGFAHDKVDIYSSSWGPTDNGLSLDKPGIFASLAIERGINEGRNGKGSIYVWASGNGGSKNDNCNCDGYCTSIYTITVGSVTQHGTLPWYSEKCASILTVTYSSGTLSDKMITTTDLRNKCTVEHTGTSASAPLAAGIIALGLEANPSLTWRDVQHIIVRTAESDSLDQHGWQRNGAGRNYNTRFGFGLMNADAFVSLAAFWKTIPPSFKETISGVNSSNAARQGCEKNVCSEQVVFNATRTTIRYLEHVEVNVNIVNKRRGNLEVYLISPSKMRVAILERRSNDNSTTGFKDWMFMSVATWSEDPRGIWFIEVIDKEIINKESTKGFLDVGNCTLILHGTRIDPETSDGNQSPFDEFHKIGENIIR